MTLGTSPYVRNHNVSIHTPTKGVTGVYFQLIDGLLVSIHTPTKGVTNATKRETSKDKVSIHTPTKGVTELSLPHPRLQGVSIHTPTKGVTNNSGGLCVINYSFNPHTHEGCDLDSQISLKGMSSFNPHTHEGCDALVATAQMDDTVSIHTPTKGVTCLY